MLDARKLILLIAAMVFNSSALLKATSQMPFRITVRDAETGRGIPLVELTTTNHIAYITDSAGVVAVDEPGLMSQRVFFHIKSHGYEYPKDGFGYAGLALETVPGGSVAINMHRINVAERLYRITGAGIYRDSVLLGDTTPIQQPLLNGQVTGQDTVETILYRGSLYWFWGDTNRPAYPLGNFAVSGAVSELPSRGGLNPEIGVNLKYFINEKGFSKKMCPIKGPGPVWIDGLMTLPDEKGHERLVAKYVRVKTLGEMYERGLVVYNDEKELFEPLARFDLDDPLYPASHPILIENDAGRYYYFPAPFPNVRIRADLKHVTDPSAYESYTCLKPGSRFKQDAPVLNRDKSGRPLWGWKRNTSALTSNDVSGLVKTGRLDPKEAWQRLIDVETGDTVITHSGSVYFNRYRNRWVMIAEQLWGSNSAIGELWYAEADTLMGPWAYARKIVTHDKYSFYNVTQHPYFDAEGGRRIYFDGTYTSTFSASPTKTPRYDYNQIMYGLSLNDRRLFLPVPVYEVKHPNGLTDYLTRERINTRRMWQRVKTLAFFALAPDRPLSGLIPVYTLSLQESSATRLSTSEASSGPGDLAFYALPISASASPQPLDNKIAGVWRCQAQGIGGEETAFTLKIAQTNGTVEGTLGLGDKQYKLYRGSFKSGQLHFAVKIENDAFALAASLKAGKLTGRWRKTTADDNDSWHGEMVDPGHGLFLSKSIVPLYEYRSVDSKQNIYSTDPGLRKKGVRRSSNPICRVWLNPAAVLHLDYLTLPANRQP